MKKPLPDPSSDQPGPSSAALRHYSRRSALKTGLTALAAGAAGWPYPLLASDKPDEALVPFLDEPRTGANQLDWETLDRWLTPSDQAFNVQHYGIPDFEVKDFRLEITGLVAKPMVAPVLKWITLRTEALLAASSTWRVPSTEGRTMASGSAL